jgi:hypothetical protein
VVVPNDAAGARHFESGTSVPCFKRRVCTSNRVGSTVSGESTLNEPCHHHHAHVHCRRDAMCGWECAGHATWSCPACNCGCTFSELQLGPHTVEENGTAAVPACVIRTSVAEPKCAATTNMSGAASVTCHLSDVTSTQETTLRHCIERLNSDKLGSRDNILPVIAFRFPAKVARQVAVVPYPT